MNFGRVITRTINAWIVGRKAKQSRRDEARLDKMLPEHAKFKGRYIVAHGRGKKSSHIHKQFVGFKTELLGR